MTRGMFYKLVFILFLIGFSVMLILPTIGEKELEVSLAPNVTEGQINTLKQRFPGEKYKIHQKNNSLYIEGYNLNAAIMNEVRSSKYPFVKNAELLPHWAEKVFLAKKINLGLDLQGGMLVVLQADYAKMEKKMGKKLTEKDKEEVTAQALEKISNRINTFGVSEPSIRPRGTEAIEIQLPGVRDPQGVKKAIKTTGSVEYRMVNEEYTRLAQKYLKENYTDLPETDNELKQIRNTIAKALQLPDDSEVLFFYDRIENTNKIYPSYPVVLKNKIELAGNDIANATETRDEYRRLAVSFNTTTEGAAKFAEVTSKKNHGKRMAIVIDDKVRSAPQINDQITSGRAIITGNFSYNEVKILARIINEGALPVDLNVIEERTVGPSLGQDSIEAGIKAIVLGLILVMIFMILYYKMAGIIANICLVLNMVFMLALLSWAEFTLTLPGIAGFILTVGMSVDANVIIYERIKEEQKNGKSARTAVMNGFERAFWTIFDANLTTLIAAFILSQVGTGPIKGFAVTLIIGIICSMFVALFVAKFIYELITLKKSIKKISI
jgi:preprotein translocase subunit SecD